MVTIRSAAPQLLVGDLRRALDFYEHRLGFKVDFVYEGFYAAVSRGGAVIHLGLVCAAVHGPPSRVACADDARAAWRP